jgi:hypothetical protein
MVGKNICLFAFLLASGVAGAKALLVLPVSGEADKASDVATVSELYKESLQSLYAGKILPGPISIRPCAEKECAMDLAAQARADEVIYSVLSRLGSKWIFSSTLMDANGGNSFNQRLTAASIEDMEAVSKRVAEALMNRKNTEQVASTENITEKEETQAPTRRRSLSCTGFSLGYLFPVNGSYSYLEKRYINFTDSFVTVPKRNPPMVRLDFMRSWEVRNNMMVGFEGVWAIPNDVGMDLNMQYLLKNTDFTPFIGGGLGLHYVIDPGSTSDKRNSGAALNAQGGLLMFRTYDFHIMARAQYQVVMNSDFDNGMIIDVGVIYQRKKETEQSSGWSTFWKYMIIATLASAVIGAAGN